MNPHLLKLPVNTEYSFSIKHDVVPYFYAQWHYHPEVELVHILKGTGTRFIGDSVDTFTDDDMLLIGANLPHMMRNDEHYYNNTPDLLAEAVTIHFLPELFGTTFLNLPENKPIADLLQQAAQGLVIKGKTKVEAKAMLNKISFAAKSERLILLMQLLNIIAYADNNELIAHNTTGYAINKADESRLNRIYQYTLNNFTHEITLKEIAAIVYMVPHSFCRYFRSRTKKRYSEFILEVRVSHACKLLTTTDYSVAVVCYESGFKNFSNFNRHFKAIVGKSPLEYRKTHQALK